MTFLDIIGMIEDFDLKNEEELMEEIICLSESYLFGGNINGEDEEFLTPKLRDIRAINRRNMKFEKKERKEKRIKGETKKQEENNNFKRIRGRVAVHDMNEQLGEALKEKDDNEYLQNVIFANMYDYSDIWGKDFPID